MKIGEKVYYGQVIGTITRFVHGFFWVEFEDNTGALFTVDGKSPACGSEILLTILKN